MEVRRITDSTQVEIVFGWLKARSTYVPQPDEMPALGWIAYEGDTPIACAFLRMVEGGHAQLDGLATDPALPGEMRHFGIDAVVQAALTKAKDMKLRSVISFSVDEGTLLRSVKHGFVPMPHALIAFNPKGAA